MDDYIPRAEELLDCMNAVDQADLLLTMPKPERRAWLRYLDPDDLADVIRAERPNILAKGSDYASSGLPPRIHEVCEQVGVLVRYTSSAKRSTTDIVQRCKAA